jgi:hypothetical protein
MRLRINKNPRSAGAGGHSQWPTTGAKQADGKQTQKRVNLFHKACHLTIQRLDGFRVHLILSVSVYHDGQN